jgi:hypothetical protein
MMHDMVAARAKEVEEEEEDEDQGYGKVMRAFARAEATDKENIGQTIVKKQKAAELQEARTALASASNAVEAATANKAVEAAEEAYNVEERKRAAIARMQFERDNEAEIANTKWSKYAKQNPDKAKEEADNWHAANPNVLYKVKGGRRYKSKRHNRISKRHNRISKRHNRISKRHNRTSKRHNRISKRHKVSGVSTAKVRVYAVN